MKTTDMGKLYKVTFTSHYKAFQVSNLKKAVYFLIPFISFFSISLTTSAQVTITAPSATATTCGTFPTNYFSLGNIVIKENTNSDFAAGNNITLVLSAPANFEFQPQASGSISYTSNSNISSATSVITANTITITYTVGGVNKLDSLILSGIMIRGINSAATNQTVTRTGGNGVINNDVVGSVHATLSSLILPTPVLTTSTSQVSCTGSSTNIALTSNPTGATFSWATGTINNVTGASSGSGNTIAQTLSSSGSPGTVQYIVTPTLNGCPGAATTITNTVNPTATVNPVSNQVVCNNSPTTSIAFSSPTNGGSITYNWSNNNTSIGLSASGTGNIASFNATNNTNSPVTATITVTPSYSNAAGNCTGTSTSFTITVNPTATVTTVADQYVCINSTTQVVNFSSPTTGGTITYNWTNSNTSIGLAASGSGNLPSFTAQNAGISPLASVVTVTPTYTNAGVTCTGTPAQFNFTINPVASVNTVSNQAVCNNSSTTAINFTSPGSGTVTYNWTNNAPYINLASSGTGNIPSFTAVNNANTPIIATITVTPSYTNGSVSCGGNPTTFTITVNPTTTLNSISNQVVCNNSATSTVNFSSPTSGGTLVYNWTNNTSSIGLASTGSGNINSFTAINSGTAPVTSTITVTPSITNSGITCSGIPQQFSILVNPTPVINPVADQTICNNGTVNSITVSGNVPGSAYSWTNSNTAIGLAASGNGNIPSFTAVNSGNSPASGTITLNAQYSNGGITCSAAPSTFNVFVNPTATVNAVSNQIVCNNSPTNAINFTSSATGAGTVSYSWVNNTPSIGLASSGNGNIPSFTATNTGNAPITATITVTPYYANGGQNCQGTSSTFTITVNPTATVTAIANQIACNNSTFSLAAFATTAINGTTTYTWTNNNTSIGLASSGNGNLPSFTASNATAGTISGTIAVTPLFTNAGVSCTGPTTTFTIVVNPIATVNAVSNQTLCNNSSTNAVNFSTSNTGIGSVNYQWQNNTTSIGLAASGTGNIPSFVATNTTNAPVTATISVTPYYVNGSSSCAGTPQSFTITVNPTATVNSVSSQTVCNYGSTSAINFTTSATGGVVSYSWTNNNSTIGLASTGNGNIPSFTATNTGNLPSTATIIVTPLFSNGTSCTGTAQSFTITANPTPTVNSVSNQTLCSNTATNAINFTGNVSGTIYRWTNNATSIGLAASGNGNIPSFTAVNSGTSPVNAIVTVTPTFTNGGASCNGSPQTINIVVNPLPVPSLSGPNPICPNTTDVYTTESGMNNYTWTETGGSITAGGTKNDASATITWGNTTGVKTIYINYTDNNGCTGATSVTVANGTGSSPGLTGPAKVCAKSTANVYTTESGKLNYSWNIPSGGTIISGGGTNDASATVRWDSSGSKSITVNYSNVGGCNAATPTSFPVIVNALPTASVSGNTTVCLNSGASNIIFSGSTGTAPYTFTYNVNGGANQTVSTVSGNNFIMVTQSSTSAGSFAYNLLNVQEGSALACWQAQSGNATVVVKPLPIATISGTTAVCANSTSPNITFTGSTGSAPYTFTYSINGGANQTVTTGSGNSSVTVPASTSTPGALNYNLLKVQEGSANACSATQSGTATVTVNPLPTASISGSTTVCIGSASPNLTFTGSGGTAPYTFSYSINGGATKTVTSSGSTATVAAPTNVAGSFVYNLLSVQDGSSTACSQSVSSASATIKIDSKPVGGTLSPNLITGACSGSNSGTISLSGQSGNVVRWEFSINGGASWSTVSPNNTSTTLSYSNLTNTSLYRAVLQNGVCSDTAVSQVSVVVVSPVFTPTVSYSPSLVICVGDSVTMSASGLNTPSSSFGDGSFDFANPAGWSVTQNGSAINFPANANNANVNPWSETNGPKTFFTALTDTITYNSGWNKFAFVNGPVTSTMETPVFTTVGMIAPSLDFFQSYHLLAGTIAKIEISTDGGNNYTGILAQYSTPSSFGVYNGGFVETNIPLTNYIGLNNLRIKFTYSSTNNSSWGIDNVKMINTFLPVSYQWNSEGVTYTTQTIKVSPPVGTHIFNLVTKTGACSITTTQYTVIVNGLPTITPGTSAVCTSSSAQTLNLPYTNPTYSPTNYTITWNSPSNGLVSKSDTLLSSSSIPIAIPASIPAGSYTGLVKVTNSNGCNSAAVSFGITVNQTPTIANQTPSAICSSGSVTLTSANFTGTNTIPSSTTYSWAAPVASGITGLSSGSNQTSFTTGTLVNTTSQPVTVVYSVTPTSPAACSGTPFTISVTVNPTQILSTVPANATLCPQPFTALSTTFGVVAANATVFQWQENRGSGWVNLTNNASYSGVTTSTLTVNNISELMEGYQYRTSLSNPSYCYSTYSAAATLLITNVWKGTTSSDWSTASNWWGNVVPDINCQYVIIPTVSTSLYPILKGTETQEVRNIVIRQNASVTVTQSSTLQVRGAIYSNIANYQYGTLDATDGKIELTGGGTHTYSGTDTAQIIAGSLFKIRTVKNLQITNPLSATVKSTANDTLNITGTLSFGNVNNTILHTGNNVTLVSNSLGTARVADITNGGVNNSNNFDGDVVVERYIKSLEHGKSWEFLATPTTGETVKQTWMENGTFASTGYGTQITSPYGTSAGFDAWSQYPSMKFYKEGASPTDPLSPDWQGFSNTGNTVYKANGYMLFIRGDRSIPGPFNPANSTRLRTKGKLLTYTVTTPFSSTDKYSSFGNPYASAIDMTKVYTDKGAAIQSFIVWKSPDYGAYGYGSYITYNLVGGKYYSVPGNVQNNNIESGQAFFIPTISGSIVFNENAKTTGFNYTVFRNDPSGVQLLRTDLYDLDESAKPALVDGTVVQFGQFSNKVDQMDTRKFRNTGLNLSIKTDDNYLVIEKRQLPQTSDTIFMNLTGAEKQHYRYVFVATGLASTGMQPFLEDHYLQTITPINTEDSTIINFQIDKSKQSSDPGRFDIIFRAIPGVSSNLFSFTSVAAIQSGTGIQVGWTTNHQRSIKQYELERSFDGNQFEKVAVISAVKSETASYNWQDERIVYGHVYYRIKAVNEEKMIFSNPAEVEVDNATSGIVVYPNPITDGVVHLRFTNQPMGRYVITLLDATGQTLSTKSIERNQPTDIQNLKWDYRLPHGNYRIEIHKPDDTTKSILLLY